MKRILFLMMALLLSYAPALVHAQHGGPTKISGVVANLQTTTTGSTFDLQNGPSANQATKVTTSSTTKITNLSDGSPATLANGQDVLVTGTLDHKTKTLAATSVVVNDHKQPVAAVGIVANLQTATTGSTFDLQEGPNASHTVSVVTTGTTTITNLSDGSPATLADGQDVFVKGIYDSVAKVITAISIVVDDHKQPVTASGTVTNLQSTATGSTFDLQNGPSTQQKVSVAATSTTTITNLSDGSPATLANGQNVLVKGLYDSVAKVITAASIIVNDHKQPVQVSGIVASLQTATTGSTFDLQNGPASNQTVSVVTTSITTITNLSDGSPATLADGEKVFVKGSYDPTSKVVTAASIIVDDHKQPVQVSGTVTNLQTTTTGSTFDLQDGPASNHKVSVVTTSTTKITNSSDGSPATLANGQKVVVQAIYDSVAKVVTATSIVVNNGRPQPKPSVTGTIASIDATAGTFVLTVKKANFPTTSTTITVAVSSATLLHDNHGKPITFADLTVGSRVEVVGTFDATSQTLAALMVILNK